MRYATNPDSSSTLEVAPFCPPEMAEFDVNDLFAACLPKLAKTARRLVRNAADSEDVLQECLLSAFKNLHQFEGRSKLSTWLHSIVRNKAKMHLRRASTNRCCSIEEKTSDQGELLLENAWDLTIDAEQRCLENERSRILRAILTELPEKQRAVIWLCDIDGLEGRDAAARLGMSLSGLKTRLHRTRKLIAKRIREGYATSRALSASAGRPELLQHGSRARTRGGRSQRSDNIDLARTTVNPQVSAPLAVVGARREFKPKRRKQEFYYLGADAGRSRGACSLSGNA